MIGSSDLAEEELMEAHGGIPALRFHGLIHEGVPVAPANLEACIKFYRDVLGLKLLPRPKALDELVPGAWLGDEHNTVQFHLIAKNDELRPESDAKIAPAGRHTAWRIESAGRFRERMRALGVPFEEIGSLIGQPQLFVKDPQGYTWEFQALSD
ncbi:MAG: VOC family protein [Stellaceae bacterium]|jgi:catechol 2,3-dioxygenase-like lactoylglutathione lyase family enzyme